MVMKSKDSKSKEKKGKGKLSLVTDSHKSDSSAKTTLFQLTPLEVARMMRFRAETEALRARAASCKSKTDALLAKLDPKGEIVASIEEQQRFNAAAALAESRHASLTAEIGKRLGIDMGRYSFDDETGILFEHVDPAPQS